LIFVLYKLIKIHDAEKDVFKTKVSLLEELKASSLLKEIKAWKETYIIQKERFEKELEKKTSGRNEDETKENGIKARLQLEIENLEEKIKKIENKIAAFDITSKEIINISNIRDVPVNSIDPSISNKASKNELYSELVQVLCVPEDREIYSDTFDYGLWNGPHYKGLRIVEEGYWVYRYPYWFIWRNKHGDVPL